jgi:hypothetical protein
MVDGVKGSGKVEKAGTGHLLIGDGLDDVIVERGVQIQWSGTWYMWNLLNGEFLWRCSDRRFLTICSVSFDRNDRSEVGR